MTGAGGRAAGSSRPTAGAKAYRPLPGADRAAPPCDAGIDAYDRGDFFEAHELLEPAWMGTADPTERALLQGLIKLAAADVHGVRGNPNGVARNLEGALDRLRTAEGAGPDVSGDVDLRDLIAVARAPPGRGPTRRHLRTHPPAEDPLMQPSAIPTVDPVGGRAPAARGSRSSRSCSTSASTTSSPRSASPARPSCRRRRSSRGSRSCQRTGRCWSSVTWAAARRP